MLKNKILGCIVGGAVGDALGYPIEFHSYNNIVSYFGKNGVSDYVFDKGLISDDTQMTLFTIEALLKENNGKYPFEEIEYYKRNIYESYKNWYLTQTSPFSKRKVSDIYDEDSILLNTEGMFDLRAPGNTCLSSLKSGKMGSIRNPINDSKGCGGVMRVAPIGLYFRPFVYNSHFVATLAGEVSTITHGHLLGNIPSSMLATMLYKICHEDCSLHQSIEESLKVVEEVYGHSYEWSKFKKIIRNAILLSNSQNSDIENIEILGGGWVAEETLAIAIYSVLRYSDDFEKAVVASVNHSGDSDSTGAVTGNIMGALLGYDKIPKRYVENLEMKDLIEEMALKLV